MDVVETTSGLGKAMWRDLREAASATNLQMRKSNLYRAAEYNLASQHGIGAAALNSHQWAIDSLGDFDTHDQDKVRPDWARKLQLAALSRRHGMALADLVSYAAEHNTNNPVILRQLRQISDAVVGPRADAADARAYLRRAAVRLHPDKCKDLEGWRVPNIAYSNRMPSDYKYEQAKWGAEGLFAMHRSFDKLYQNPHYAAALYGPTAAKGGSLKPNQAAAEFSLVSALYFLFAPEATAVATGVCGAGAAIIAVWWLCKAVQQQRAKQAEVTCRDLVLFDSKNGLGQQQGEV